MMTKETTIHFWLKAVWLISLAIISVFSLIPGSSQPPLFEGFDKLQHFLAYAWLAFLQVCIFKKQRTVLAMTIALIAWGITLEVLQGYVPYRFMSVADALANSIGCFIGTFFGFLILSRNSRLDPSLEK